MKNPFNLSLILLALLLPATVFAHDFEVDGIYYNINGNEATVTYRGTSYYQYSNEYSGDVTIPTTVTYGGTAYTVTSIGNSAFSNCTELNSIDIPNSVIFIGGEAFCYCSSLTSITIPHSVTFIGDDAFFSCSLTSIVVASGNTKYDSRNNCNAIIETASNTLFLGCQNTIIPNTVVSIGYGAFSGCTGLASITIPNSVSSIGESAFAVSGITSIDIPNSVKTISPGAFMDCDKLSNVTIGDHVTDIGFGAFFQCTNLARIDIPNSVTYIGDMAFQNCFGMTSLTIGNSVTTIGECAFNYCIGLTCLAIPNSVTNIGYGAFSDCIELKEVYSYSSNPSLIAMGDGVFCVFSSWQGNYSGRTLYVPAGSSTVYQADNRWSSFFGTIVEMDPVLVSSIKLNVTSVELNGGETLQLTATVLPEDASDKSVIWASSNPNVATVDGNGLVTAVGVGNATVTAVTTDGSNLSASCAVTVKNPSTGDVNGDGMVNIADVTSLIDILISGTIATASADVNGNGTVNIADVTDLIDMLLRGFY